jgi:hypothetical protein
MSLRSSILLRATRQNSSALALRRHFLDSASRNLNMSALGDNSAAITNALNTSGTIPIETFTITFRDLSDESVERTLRGMADGDAASQLQFDELVKEMVNTNSTALRKFYTDNPSLQSQIKASVGDNADTFFKGMDGSVKGLNESQIKNLGAAQAITRAGFAAADGGKKFFIKVWDSIGSGRALNTTRFGITVGVAWIVIDVLASLTGQTKLEFFSDLFEFIKDPSASLFANDDGDGINGSWQLTGLGQMVFGTVALFGIAIAVKLIKTLTPSEA